MTVVPQKYDYKHEIRVRTCFKWHRIERAGGICV